MTRKEVAAVLAMLSAYYGRPKDDAHVVVEAWNAIIGEYEFQTAREAVIQYAKNDTRQYASFPAPGVIVKAIRNRQVERERPILAVMSGINKGTEYRMLPYDAQQVVSEEKYEEWLKMNPLEFINRQEQYINELMGKKYLEG